MNFPGAKYALYFIAKYVRNFPAKTERFLTKIKM